MILSHINYLQCVDCGADLKAIKYELHDGVIEHGLLSCCGCGRQFVILDQVGLMFRSGDFFMFLKEHERRQIIDLGYESALPEDEQNVVKTKQAKVSENWEFQHKEIGFWSDDKDAGGYHSEENFKTFIRIDPKEYVGRKVVVACVGRGKEVYYALKFGADLVFVNEIGDEIYDVPKIFVSQKQKLVVCRFDLRYSPFKDELADIAICDHALQHVEDHMQGYLSLSAMAKPGGKVGVCVYSHENNFLMTHIVEPSKVVLQHIPNRALFILSYLPALLIFIYIQFILSVKALISSEMASNLPMYDHMIFWSKNRFKFLAITVFDLSHAPVSYHFSRADMENLATSARQKMVVLENTNGTTWSMVTERR